MRDKKLVYKMRADKIKWKTDHWEIVNFYKRYINGLDEKIIEGAKMDTTLALLPEDFGKTEQNKDLMITPELKQYIAKERSRGVSGLALFEVEVYRRSAVPFATILLTIMGYAIASRKMRGGMGLHLAFGAGLSSSFVILQQFSQMRSNTFTFYCIDIWFYRYFRQTHFGRCFTPNYHTNVCCLFGFIWLLLV